MRLQQFLDPGGKESALVEHGGERGGQAGDDQRRSVGAGHDDGLLVQRVEDTSTSRSAMRGALGFSMDTSRRLPAFRNCAGEP